MVGHLYYKTLNYFLNITASILYYTEFICRICIKRNHKVEEKKFDFFFFFFFIWKWLAPTNVGKDCMFVQCEDHSWVFPPQTVHLTGTNQYWVHAKVVESRSRKYTRAMLNAALLLHWGSIMCITLCRRGAWTNHLLCMNSIENNMNGRIKSEKLSSGL